MDIQAAVSSARSFSELRLIAERAQPHFSFWGSRYVTVSGYEGILDIDALASRTMELLDQFNFEFSLAEHNAGKRLAARIDRIYDEHLEQVNQADCFTRVLDVLRNFPCALFNYLMYGDRGVIFRWRGQEQYNDSFDCYSRTQFQNAFHMSPEEAERRDLVESCATIPGWVGPPDIWVVKEHLSSPLYSTRSTT
jgi:hypothetical protein